MEYYIFVTYNCNMFCSYCSARAVLSHRRADGETAPDISRITDYVKRDIAARSLGNTRNRIVFFGGEPLLACDVIRKVLVATRGLDMDYWLYTNGLVLDTAPLDILSRMGLILVSLDGDKQSHERHRGVGTYDVIMDNIAAVRRKVSVPILGRITVEESTDCFRSVSNVLRITDSVYWQIVNKPHFSQPAQFIHAYQQGLKRLFEFWLEELYDGVNLGVIPFQAVADSLLDPATSPRNPFRCGCGTSLQAIDLDGRIYECDEYVGTSSGQIGCVEDDCPLSLNCQSHYDIHPECLACEWRAICRGRCKRSLRDFDRDQVGIYCEATRGLIRLVSANIERIQEALMLNGIEKIYMGPVGTEELP